MQKLIAFLLFVFLFLNGIAQNSSTSLSVTLQNINDNPVSGTIKITGADTVIIDSLFTGTQLYILRIATAISNELKDNNINLNAYP